MTELLGQSLFEVWQELCSAIDEKPECEVFRKVLDKFFHGEREQKTMAILFNLYLWRYNYGL